MPFYTYGLFLEEIFFLYKYKITILKKKAETVMRVMWTENETELVCPGCLSPALAHRQPSALPELVVCLACDPGAAHGQPPLCLLLWTCDNHLFWK